MKRKAAIAYGLLLTIVFFVHLFPSRITDYLLPLFMIVAPLLLGGKMKFSVSLRQVRYAFSITLLLLVPTYFFLLLHRPYHLMGASAMFAQMIRIALPEEIFFRGFLQEAFGNNIKGIVLVSLLFAGAHLPVFFLYHDVAALLTFFPSLVMGFLYMRTSSLIPPVLFHFLANVVFRGFMI